MVMRTESNGQKLQINVNLYPYCKTLSMISMSFKIFHFSVVSCGVDYDSEIAS